MHILTPLTYSLWARLPTNLWTDLPMAVRDEYCNKKSRWGWVRAGGGGKLL